MQTIKLIKTARNVSIVVLVFWVGLNILDVSGLVWAKPDHPIITFVVGLIGKYIPLSAAIMALGNKTRLEIFALSANIVCPSILFVGVAYVGLSTHDPRWILSLIFIAPFILNTVALWEQRKIRISNLSA